MKKDEGILTYNQKSKRLCIAFCDHIWDLHCGYGFEILVSGKWIRTAAEMAWPDQEWYLAGLPKDYDYMGSRVRV